ncbi:L-histidine N(alpha)-methyltransferase [Allorhodopirellula solitaria]|uniref:Histidine-specific methyltransferase EgtD n=1 Tax=Allorhodopirellula solitaria TaxID=2527987 RepID=A0A5C5WN92_9BACT|nr:L-histidine N(alpha)-methyltransferase [Allorhodopirellula solitaria]TWT51655.1 Histidine-specific methyltransferase EgtD [Allorhodopirellula solitaria]
MAPSNLKATSPPTCRIPPGPINAAVEPKVNGFAREVVKGLLESPKRIDSKHLYDERGSKLFDKICQLPEYYLTRTEQEIMQANVADIVREVGPNALLVELGSGSSQKTRLLLDRLEAPRAYVPIDISAEHLRATARRLRAKYPALEVKPIVGDFTHQIEMPAGFADTSVCIYFPGSTIGNLPRDDAKKLLRIIADRCGQDGGLLIGFDLHKSKSVLEAAYNDSQGVTAAFSINLLRRLNREANANFDIQRFRHVAFYNPSMSRIEIYLESIQDQVVRVGGGDISFARHERILTEYSHKYTLAGFSEMAEESGLTPTSVWLDQRNYFAVMYLEARDGS